MAKGMAKGRAKGRAKLRLVQREHTLLYGLRLLPDQVLAEQTHPRVEVPRPDGGSETLTLHTITGDREEIRRKLLESVDAFFEIYGDTLS
jgi:hypothetical protein